MKRAFYVGLIALSATACAVKPEPLAYGKDSCYACKMTLVDSKFGAEVLTRKGKVYKFDDVNCMMGFLKSGFEPSENIKDILVVDFEHEGLLIDAKSAGFLYSEKLNTPMASGIGVFASKGQAELKRADFPGEVFDWEQTKTKF